MARNKQLFVCPSNESFNHESSLLPDQVTSRVEPFQYVRRVKNVECLYSGSGPLLTECEHVQVHLYGCTVKKVATAVQVRL